MAVKFCALSSGSSGNAYFIKSEEISILVDAGISGKQIESRLEQIGECITDVKGIFVTHEHMDHIKSLSTLSRKYEIPIYTNEATWEKIKSLLKKTEVVEVHYFEANTSIDFFHMEIKSFSVPHDAVNPVGYSIVIGGNQLSILTDLGVVNERIIDYVVDSDLLVIEANHDEDMLKVGTYPWFLKKRILGEQGHLSNEAAGNVLLKLLDKKEKYRKVLLGHISKENNFPKMAFQTIKNILEERDYLLEKHISVSAIVRDEISEVYVMK